MSQSKRVVPNPDGVHPPIGAYSHLARASGGSTLYLAGQVGLDATGSLTGDGGVRAQTLQTFHNIGRVIESAGASWADVVQFTTYLVGRAAVQPFLDARRARGGGHARREAFAEFFPDGAYPPNTLLLVVGLVREDLLVEVTTIAVVD